jgi:hypothetical protein
LYALYTLPKLCTPSGYKQNSDELSHDFQAVGAQAVNHLANKIMLALFAPSRPFFRADPDKSIKDQLASLDMSEQDLEKVLADGEKQSVAELDRMALRPKLYEAVKQLIVLGNTLLCLEDDTARVIGIKKYVVRRSMSGQVLELMIADRVMFDELEPEVQQHILSHTRVPEDREVTLYKWIKRDASGDYHLTQWVDTWRLPKKFDGKWPYDKMPYRVLTWDLSDDAHYGTGLVEDYKGDFAGLSALSQAQIKGAILSSEFRWLVNPAGMTKVEDMMASENGACLPGQKDDISLVESGKSGDLQITMNMSAEYVTRIGRGFLLGSAVTRDAERVTAEEIRLNANELETSLGGAYSRLAVDFQVPMAYWLLAKVGMNIRGKGITPRIVTGLEALSRNGDLDELKLWLTDVAQVSQIAQAIPELKRTAILQGLAIPRRIDVSGYLETQEETAARQQAEQEAAIRQQAAQVGAQAGADIAVNKETQA